MSGLMTASLTAMDLPASGWMLTLAYSRITFWMGGGQFNTHSISVDFVMLFLPTKVPGLACQGSRQQQLRPLSQGNHQMPY